MLRCLVNLVYPIISECRLFSATLTLSSLSSGTAEALQPGPPVYAVIGDYIEIRCQIDLTRTALWHYTWETPENETLTGCPVHYVSSAQWVDQGVYKCKVRDPVLSDYNIAPIFFSVETSRELIVLSGNVF